MTSPLAQLIDAVLALRRDVRRLMLAQAPTLSRSEVAELLGAQESAVGAWLDAREHLLVSGPGKERRYSGPRIRQALEVPEARTKPSRPERKGRVVQLPRPTTSA